MPTMTITTTTDQAQRVAAAVGSARGLTDENGAPRSANATEVKEHTVQYLKHLVRAHETRAAEESARAGVTEIEPT